MWGVFGPLSFRTRRGTRVTLVAGFITLPLSAISLYSLLHAGAQPSHPPQQGPSPERRLPEA